VIHDSRYGVGVENKVASRARLSAGDKAAMRAYWEFYEPIADEISEALRISLSELPEWAPIIKASATAQARQQEQDSRARQREAVVNGNWAPYLDELRIQGMSYAKMGISFVAWYDIIAIYREIVRRRVLALGKVDLEKMAHVGDGMNRLIDIGMSHLGEAYLAAKEQIIAQQAEAIRELSLPILQVREHLLIVPLVGVIDSTRARQLIETLLAAIRDRRALGVVIDVTGVPLVDTAVANYLVQVCEAAALMGSCVVITGISSDMAQTLVGLGAKLSNIDTLVDLQEGIAHIEHLLTSRAE